MNESNLITKASQIDHKLAVQPIIDGHIKYKSSTFHTRDVEGNNYGCLATSLYIRKNPGKILVESEVIDWLRENLHESFYYGLSFFRYSDRKNKEIYKQGKLLRELMFDYLLKYYNQKEWKKRVRSPEKSQ